jgi:hypothetical protein
MADFNAALDAFIAGVNRIYVEAKLHCPRCVRLRSGQGKYLALDVIEFDRDDPQMEGDGRPTSVFCFVAAEETTTKGLGLVSVGDVLKAAGYKKPAKHARGNIFDDHNGLRGRSGQREMAWTGPEYL